MNVRSVYSTVPGHVEAAQTRSERAQERPRLQEVTDSFILSARARTVLDEMRSRPDLDRSIKSRMRPEPLSERRAYDVIGRLDDGYYRESHVLHYVASSVSGALTYGP